MKTIEIFAEAVKFASEASDIPSDYCRRAATLTLWTQECSLFRRFMTSDYTHGELPRCSE